MKRRISTLFFIVGWFHTAVYSQMRPNGGLAISRQVTGTTAMSENIPQPPPPPDLKSKYYTLNAIGPRYQWEDNGGYCGEVSLISAGLYYGQYLSQFDVRTMAWASQDSIGRDTTKNEQQSVQLLLGVNDSSVAQMLKLDADVYEVPDSIYPDNYDFLKWVKKNVVKGYPVIIGVFNNECLLYKKCIPPTAGDSEYDHIVPVIGWGSPRPLDNEDITGDTLLISDNGLYGPDTGSVPDSDKYYYKYGIPSFLADRAQANANNPSRIYSLLRLTGENDTEYMNYAIAIKGVLDKNHETLPVKLITDKNYEAPKIMSDQTRPKPESITLTIKVSGLVVGQTYDVYYYRDEKDVPVKDFNKKSKNHLFKEFKAIADTWTGSLTIQSNEKAFFRAVNKTAD